VTPSALPARVAQVRAFNRFYTRQIGVLQEGYLHSPFSLTAVRVLYELAHHDATSATDLARQLDLDAGYLSRILTGFLKRGLIDKRPARRDGRQSELRLTDHGREVFAPLDRGAQEQIGGLLARLSDAEQQQLVEAMRTIERLLEDTPPDAPKTPYVLRPPHPGDLGWVVQRHGALYAQEYGYDEHFEALVASIVAHFVERFDPRRERCWIAERAGAPVGCIFLVRGSPTIGKLRLFLVEPSARGLHIGRHLIDECIRFARLAGYRRIRLWTQSELLAARHLYARAGFLMINSEPHHSYSKDLVAETWELRL
jgi:DNA-binding MarR family transcriptional regulator/N-acetylglutamate synthase-like GNAT family acetyltransferase